VELLTIDRSCGLADGLPGIDRVHSVPIHYRFTGPAALFFFIKKLFELRRERFDALVNFSLISSYGGLLKARLVNRLVRPALSSCRALAGLGEAGGNCVLEEFVENRSEVELTARLLTPLGIELRDTEITYSPGFEAKRKVVLDLAARGIAGSPVIGLNPGAFRPSRRWPPENWKRLAGLLLEKYPGAAIIVTGSAAEAGMAAELEIPGRVFSAAGRYSVRENSALYGLMDVFITNDTGPMHIAAAAGAKVAGIFGPGDFRRFAPSVPASRVRLVRKDVPGCRLPCYKYSCSDPVCLTAISPHEVLAAAAELLEAGGGARS
jgi:ADP-heptose:LPS heptosyltransferase